MTARVLRKSAAPVVFDAKTARLEALEAEVVELRARVEAAEARAATLGVIRTCPECGGTDQQKCTECGGSGHGPKGACGRCDGQGAVSAAAELLASCGGGVRGGW